MLSSKHSNLMCFCLLAAQTSSTSQLLSTPPHPSSSSDTHVWLGSNVRSLAPSAPTHSSPQHLPFFTDSTRAFGACDSNRLSLSAAQHLSCCSSSTGALFLSRADPRISGLGFFGNRGKRSVGRGLRGRGAQGLGVLKCQSQDPDERQKTKALRAQSLAARVEGLRIEELRGSDLGFAPLSDQLSDFKSYDAIVNVFPGTTLPGKLEIAWIIGLSAILAYLIFPDLARMIVPIAFPVERPMEGGRPIADSVLATVVSPVVGICFATLGASTLNTLRQRQQDIRTGIAQEAVVFDTVIMPLNKLFAQNRHRKRRAYTLMLTYARAVQEETSGKLNSVQIQRLLELERELMLALLAVIGEVDGDLTHGSVQESVILGRVVGYAQSLVNEINRTRSKRRSCYLSAFPKVHWIILLSLAAIIPFDFAVLATTQKGVTLELFEDEFLRCLFAALSMVVTAVMALLLDLNDPFQGFYSVTDGQSFRPIAKAMEEALELLDEADPRLLKEQHKLLDRALRDPFLVAAAEDPEAIS